MFSSIRKPARFLASAAVLSSGIGAFALLNLGSAAHADPAYEATGQPYACSGSDTLQDLFNAYAGAEPTQGAQPSSLPSLPTKFYTPLHSQGYGLTAGNNSGSATIASFDALDPHLNTPNPLAGDGQTITTKLNGTSFNRPNGSGDGRKALDDAINSVTWVNGNNSGNIQSVSGQLDCARSSSVAGTATASTTPSGDMSYIPVGSDGVGYAYHCVTAGNADCQQLAHLSNATLKALYNGPVTTAGTGDGVLSAGTSGWAGTNTLKACAINTGSGTFQFFLKQLGLGSDYRSQAQTNLTQANGSQCTQVEENALGTTSPATGFLGTSNTADPTADWIIPVSVGNLTAQHNGVALNRSSGFFGAGGVDIAGLGVAPVADGVATTTLQAAAAAGATSLQVGIATPVGSTLTVDFGTGAQENVTVTGLSGAASPFTITLSAPTANAHANGAAVNYAVPYLNDGTATWAPLSDHVSGTFGRWVFVVVPSAKIAGRGIDHGLADLFYNTTAAGGTAAVCSSAALTTLNLFGFDTVRNNVSQTGGSCGLVAFVQTGAA